MMRSYPRRTHPATVAPDGTKPRAAFTLIELFVVISIIHILASILFPVFAQRRERRDFLTKLKSHLWSVKVATPSKVNPKLSLKRVLGREGRFKGTLQAAPLQAGNTNPSDPVTLLTLSPEADPTQALPGQGVNGSVSIAPDPSGGTFQLTMNLYMGVQLDGSAPPLPVNTGDPLFSFTGNVDGDTTLQDALTRAASNLSLQNPADLYDGDQTFQGQLLGAEFSAAPEPPSWALLGVATACLGGYFGWRRWNRRATA